jgi:oligopeptidase B
MDASPPIANVIPKQLICHGDVRVDNYYWLRERDNPEVLAYLEAENRYTEHVMEPVKDLQQKLYEEMLGRIHEDDSGVPFPLGSFLYYTRTEKAKPIRFIAGGFPMAPSKSSSTKTRSLLDISSSLLEISR